MVRLSYLLLLYRKVHQRVHKSRCWIIADNTWASSVHIFSHRTRVLGLGAKEKSGLNTDNGRL